MTGLRFVRAIEDACEYRRLLGIAPLPHSDLTGHYVSLGEYYASIFGDRTHEISFLAMSGGAPVAAVHADLTDDIVGHFKTPVEILFSPDCPDHERGRIGRAVVRELMALGTRGGARTLVLGERVAPGRALALPPFCVGMDGVPTVETRAVADLSLGEDALRRDLRKSFRSLVNWGRRNLALRYVTRQDPDRELFWRFADFHRETAGRWTRPRRSWELTFERIAAGLSELTLGFLDGQLVAGTMVSFSGATAIYASGVYDRRRFDKPMAHWPVFLAMLRCAESGLRFFDLGIVPAKGTVDDKSHRIGYFKRGFTSRFENSIQWRIPLSSNVEDDGRERACRVRGGP